MAALVVDALNRIAREVSIDAPVSWATATEDEYLEIRDDFMPQVVEDVLARFDLPSPIGKEFDLTGTGAETYDLPADFKRLTRGEWAVYESTTFRRPLLPVTDDNHWNHIKERGTSGVNRYYRLSGYPGAYSISIYREPTSPIRVRASYVSTSWLMNGATEKSDFTDAGDVMLLPREIIETGVVTRWRDRKGLDADRKRLEYEQHVARYFNDARSIRVIGTAPGQYRSPFDIPVPDVIPSA